jgi:hypothetical protein
MNRTLLIIAGAVAIVAFAGLLASSARAADGATGEVAPAKSLPCFPGAIYRKAVSSDDLWTGIEGIVTLPRATFDPQRTNPKTGRPLDNPSIYMGGRAGQREIDAGVSWEVIKEPDGSVSSQRKTYRPFWRNEKWNSGPAQPEYDYYPGDTILLSVVTRQADKLELGSPCYTARVRHGRST